MRKIKRRMAVLLLVMVMLISGGCQNMHHLSANQTSKDDADTGTGYNIYYINNDETRIKAFAYQLSSTTEDGIISECMEALSQTPDDKNYKEVFNSSVKVQQYNYDKDSRTLSLFFSKEYAQMPKTTEMLVGTVVSLAIPDIILSMFQADAELMRAGMEALRLISLGFLVSSAGVIFSGVFEALGRGGDSLIISLLRQLVIILPLGYLLSRTMGAAGIWISFPVAELVSAVIACLLLKRMEGGIYFPFDKKEIINRK